MTIQVIKRDGKPVGIVDDEGNGVALLQWFHAECAAYSMSHALEHEGYSVDEGEPDCGDVSDLLEGIAARVGLEIAAAEFVPFSRSRNAAGGHQMDSKAWESLNWKITLQRRGRPVLTSDYGQGLAYAPASKRKTDGTRYMQGLRDRAARAEMETGTVHEFGEGAFYGPDGTRNTRRPIAPPALGDLLHSLALDASALDYAGFDDWAREYGYDTDSRKAESAYRECLATATALRASLGESVLAEIRLAAQFN